MNNNFLDNLQALNLLVNLQSQSRAQLLQRQSAILANLASNGALNLACTIPNPLFQMPSLIPPAGNPLQMGNQEGLLSRVYQNNLQSEIIKAQMLGGSAIAQEGFNPQALRPIAPNEMNGNVVKQPNILCASLYNFKITQEAHVKNIVDFLILNFGLVNQSDIEREKQKYSHDEVLSQIFNNIVLKYTSMNKTKEEMIKYVFRKALKSIKDKLKGTLKKSDKEVTKVFFQKYFSVSKEEMLKKKNINTEDEEELMKLLMPFKKTSTNKTLNSNFLSKVFASEEFCHAYEEYLTEFEREADFDNGVKIKKFVEFIMTCIKTNKISQILNYKRVPWLKSWVLSTKNIGFQLMYEKSPRKIRKVERSEKVEFNPSNEIDTSESECKLEEGSTAVSG